MEIYAFMSIIDQGVEIHKHIALEKGINVTIHPIYIAFTNFNYCNKITHKLVMQLSKFDQNMHCF
jgi:hypothetical protein